MGDNMFVSFDFGNGDRLNMLTDSLEGLTEDDFLFNVNPADVAPIGAAPSNSGTNSSVVNLVVDSQDDIPAPATASTGDFRGEVVIITRPEEQEPAEAAPVVVEPAPEDPVVETPVAAAPAPEAPVVETPVVAEPAPEAPVIETPVAAAPAPEAPVVVAP